MSWKIESIGRGENILSSYSESDINNIIKNRLPFTTEEERYEVYPLSKMPDFIKLNKEKYSWPWEDKESQNPCLSAKN